MKTMYISYVFVDVNISASDGQFIAEKKSNNKQIPRHMRGFQSH